MLQVQSIEHSTSNAWEYGVDQRIADLAGMAISFLYVVSVKGKTGARDALSLGLGDAFAKVRAKTNLPLVVGFDISNPEMVNGVSNLSDRAVVGSFLTDCLIKMEHII